MKRIAWIFCLCFPYMPYAQSIPSTVSFKTPEVSAFNRNIETPVSFYTGIPSISIPLYDISIKGVSVPVTLEYHAGGIRVDQEATWVGLGWSLNYGGEISRKVRGLPDENFYFSGTGSSGNSINYFNSLAPPNSQSNIEQRQSYLGQAKPGGGSKDYMPDEFYYSVQGYNGKFMFGQGQNKFITFPKDDIDISYTGAFWKLKLPTGVSADFGGEGYSMQKDFPQPIMFTRSERAHV